MGNSNRECTRSFLSKFANWLGIGLAVRCLAAVALSGVTLLSGCQRPEQPEAVQRGFRGLNTAQLYKPSELAAGAALNSIPEAEEAADPDSPLASEVFKNVKVLSNIKATEFSRLMQAMSTWVAPQEGCNYCHNPKNLASDEKYTKVVARRMLQMTLKINTEWKTHVAATGVTCWTCHRGQAVPSGDWFASPVQKEVNSMGERAGQNRPSLVAAGSSLPEDPLSTFLVHGDNNIRVQGVVPMAATGASANRRSVKQTEWTYSMMTYVSKSLGVNCSYCHATRAFANWEQSPPARATAWYGIRMVRNLNADYLIPLKPLFPAHRLSAEGDTPKVGCLTCHKGAFKPLYGVSPLTDYPLLGVITPPPPPTPPDAAASAAMSAPAGAPAASPEPAASAPVGKVAADSKSQANVQPVLAASAK
jgi:photosynthetic reaction center cytochrome c subunit